MSLSKHRASVHSYTLILILIMFSLSMTAGCYDPELAEPSVTKVPPFKSRPIVTRPTTPVSIWPAGWVPPTNLENRSRWKGIMIHHSADEFGDAASFDAIHKQRGWDGLGYHFVICNGNNANNKGNGAIEVGHRWRVQREGAHCRVDTSDNNYWNEHTIGICLVGNFMNHKPTESQWNSLVKLIKFLQARYNIPTNKINGHRDVKATQCPGAMFSFAELRSRLARAR